MPDPHVSRQFKEFGTGDDYDPKTPYGKCIDCREGITPDSAPFCHNCQQLHEEVFPVNMTKTNTEARLSRKKRGLFISQGRKEGEERARMEQHRRWQKEKKEKGEE